LFFVNGDLRTVKSLFGVCVYEEGTKGRGRMSA
jgi:hypothetical protein